LDDINKGELRKFDVFRPLIALLGSETEDVCAAAAGALLNLLTDGMRYLAIITVGFLTRLAEEPNRVELRKCEGIAPLIFLLHSSHDELLVRAAGALAHAAFNGARSPALARLCLTSGRRRGERGRDPASGRAAAADCAPVAHQGGDPGSGVHVSVQLRRQWYGAQSSPRPQNKVVYWRGSDRETDEESRLEIRELGGLGSLIALLSSPNDDCQANAAGAIMNCAATGARLPVATRWV
jgi:hypothetical protein